jgi:periplasmic protein TonB
MFSNLIESSSHVREFKRRGSFILFTTLTYALLFVITGVVSILAYDAKLQDQNLEIVTLISPQDIPQPDVAPAAQPEHPRNTNNNENVRVPERAVAMLSVNHPESVPETISAAPNRNLPLPDRGIAIITGRDLNPTSPGGSGPASGTGRQIAQPSQVINITEPPPPPDIPKPAPKVVSKGVITSQAISLPKPVYPPIAKQMGIQGTVSIQVLVDEHGIVLSAKTLSGHPFLTSEAQKAALRARFSPTMLGDQPVKVSGVITYNFVLSN